MKQCKLAGMSARVIIDYRNYAIISTPQQVDCSAAARYGCEMLSWQGTQLGRLGIMHTMSIPFVIGGLVGARYLAKLASAIGLADDSAQLGAVDVCKSRELCFFLCYLFIPFVTTRLIARKQQFFFFFAYRP